MSFFDGVPAYRGVINDTGWSDASALQFTGDAANAIVSVYNQQFTPVLEADSKFLVLEFADSTAPAPYSHGYIDVEYISPEYAYNWATLVNAMLRVSSPLTLSTPTAPNTYSTIGFEWPSLSNQQIVLADDAKTLVSLAPGSDSKQFLKTGSAGVAPSWVQVAWGDLTSVPSWLNATYAQYGVAYAATTSSMATTLPGSSGYFLRSGGGGAAPEFKQVDTANLSGITWGTGTYKVAYTPDALGKTFAFSNALASGKYLGYNGGVPGFVTIPYTDISGTPTLPSLPLAIADGGTGVSTAPSAGQLPYASSGTAYSYTNAVATSKYLGYNAGVPGFVTISYNDLADLPYLPLVILSTPTNGQLLIGNTSTNAFEVKTLTGTSNRVTVTNGAGSITLSGPQDIDTAADAQFGYISIGTARAANYANRIANSVTASAGSSPFGWVQQITATRSDTSTSFGAFILPTFGIGSTTGGTVYGTLFEAPSKSGGGSITTAYNVSMPTPTIGTNCLALHVGSLGIGYGAWTDSTTAEGSLKVVRIGISQNPSATKALAVTGGVYAQNLCVGTATASTNPPTNGMLVQGAIKNSNLFSSSLVATDSSQQLTTTTSGITATLAGVNFGDATLSKYTEYSWLAVTIYWYATEGGLANATTTSANIVALRVGRLVTIQIPVSVGTAPANSVCFDFTIGDSDCYPTLNHTFPCITYISSTRYLGDAQPRSSGTFRVFATLDHVGYWPSGATSCFERVVSVTYVKN